MTVVGWIIRNGDSLKDLVVDLDYQTGGTVDISHKLDAGDDPKAHCGITVEATALDDLIDTLAAARDRLAGIRGEQEETAL